MLSTTTLNGPGSVRPRTTRPACGQRRYVGDAADTARFGHENEVAVPDMFGNVVHQAAERLADAGHHPRLGVGDGTGGMSDAAPFDRIIATCAVDRIPPAWIDQLAPDGRIVTPLTHGGALAVLDHTTDGEVAGHIDPCPVYFMSLRTSADSPTPDGRSYHLPPTQPASACHRGTTDTDPAALADPDFQLWLALHLPAARIVPTTGGAAIIHTDSDRADVPHRPIDENTWAVTQHNHRLWDTVETAWRTYDRTGRPGRDRLGLTARRTPDQQYAWLDHPGSRHTWPLP